MDFFCFLFLRDGFNESFFFFWFGKWYLLFTIILRGFLHYFSILLCFSLLDVALCFLLLSISEPLLLLVLKCMSALLGTEISLKVNSFCHLWNFWWVSVSISDFMFLEFVWIWKSKHRMFCARCEGNGVCFSVYAIYLMFRWCIFICCFWVLASFIVFSFITHPICAVIAWVWGSDVLFLLILKHSIT